MENRTHSDIKILRKRLTALLVAVVFVLGTAVVPAEIYGVEAAAGGTDEQAAAESAAAESADAVDQAAPADTGEEGAAQNDDSVTDDAEAAETETTETETEAAEAMPEEEALTEEDAIAELSDVITVDLNAVDEDEYDGFIYKLEDDTAKKEIKEMENAIEDLDAEQGQEVSEVVEKELYTADSIETIAEVASSESIEYIEPDYLVTTAGTSDYYYEEDGWYLEMIGAPKVWESSMFGSGATVAVLDSGVYTEHADFENTSFTESYNATSKSSAADDSGHGTAVAGIIAASYDNKKGLTGVMPETKIMPVKVMYVDSDGYTVGKTSDVVKGINTAVSKGADVINMSFGTGNIDVSLQTACKNAAAKGVILVASSGNDGTGGLYYPASYSTVISVGSVGSTKACSSFSNHNSQVSVTAPGEKILAPGKASKNSYVRCTGTSFSAPQVSAMAAMVKAMAKEANLTVNYAGFMDVIKTTSADSGAAGFDVYYGYGLMDLAKAYRHMNNDVSVLLCSLSATSYAYNGSVRTPSVTIKKAGNTVSSGSYKLTYAAGRKAVGTYKVTAQGVGSYVGSKTLSFRILPPLVKSLKSPQRYKKKLNVRWKAMSKSQKKKYKSAITGYQVRVSTSSKFTNAKYKKVKGITKTKATVKGLKRKTTYYVQYRAYKVVGGTTYYSKWSAKKKAKTR